MWIFLNLNKDVKSCAVSLFFAIIKTPDVSLSNLWTEYGFVPSNILLFLKISIKFFFDLVPPCTDIPDSLLTTMKSSLLSIMEFSFALIITLEGLKFIFFAITFSLISILNKSTLSFVLPFVELFAFFLFSLIFPVLSFFSIKPWGIYPNLFLKNLSRRMLFNVASTTKLFIIF